MTSPHQRPLFRPSVSSRLSIAISTHSAEAGEAQHEDGEQIDEEIEEIRRYEDFTTIDWVQDAARAQLQRRIQKRKEGYYVRTNWRRKLWLSYDAGQAWIVISLIGVCIGLNASFLNIVTEWLSDIKLGHCSTAFYLNENFCCWGAEDGCPEWKTWSTVWPVNYLLYILFSILFAYTSAILVKSFAPYAAGSGISEIKCILAGFVMKGFLSGWTLLIKSIGLPLAIASGLSVGKEGPSVHYAVCTGNVISRFFEKYRKNAAKTREILSACAAAGVAVAFGSPIGGVLFSLEEMSSNFPLKTMWRSYFCALVATAVLAAMNPFRTGQLVMFQVTYDRDWHFFEVVFFIIIGIFGGLYGEFVIKWNLRAQSFRKKYLKQWAIAEATFLAGITAVICYSNMFLRIDMTESMEILFHECEGGHDYNGLCESSRRWHMVTSLTFATVVRVFLVIISYGCKVPAGIFVPSMAIGASFGRTVGILVQALHEAVPNSRFFASCEPDMPCITPGTYAFLGAAAALSGIMHITVSVVVIMFELTGALTYILPTMIVVGVTKAVSDRFGKAGIADRMIWFNGFPFLDNKEDHSFGVPVSHVMNQELTVLPSTGMAIREVETILESTEFQGFPIVQDRNSKLLIGYINRTELKYGIDRAKRERTIPPTSRCYFLAPDQTQTPASTVGMTIASSRPFSSGSSSLSLDFARYIDPTPLTVHPRLPLETVMEIFKKVGPRVMLVEHRGKLSGVVTRKDVLKFQFKVENRENPRDDSAEVGREEKLWGIIVRVSLWLRRKVLRQEAPPAGERIRESDAQDGLLDVEASSMDLELGERR
ncbi:chloride channel [Tuber borchii]|uniref:Chloride channel protein n=1 Tax=Tuber borchii TaxID=42251 RepID=A0A2T6ZV90_TUBBO|nr:chloride channel [Tuber borchii]